jgi:hypothetical protein
MKKLVARLLGLMLGDALLTQARAEAMIVECNRELVAAGCTPLDTGMEACLRAPRDTRPDPVLPLTSIHQNV